MRRARDRCEKGEKEEMMEAKGEQNRGLCSGDSCRFSVLHNDSGHDTKRAHTHTHKDQ